MFYFNYFQLLHGINKQTDKQTNKKSFLYQSNSAQTQGKIHIGPLGFFYN